MPNDMGKRIRNMAKACDEETIAKTIGIPLDVVKGVLSGDISDEILENFDPAKPPDIRIVEQRKIVRSLVTGVFSFGNSGATTLTSSLALLSAKQSGASTAAVDLNEFANLGDVLKIPEPDNKPNLNGWLLSNNLPESLITHHKLKNLFILLGAKTLSDFINIPATQISLLLKDLGGICETVWIECPVSPAFWPIIINELDIACFILNPSYNSITAFYRALTIFTEYNPDKFVVVFNEPDTKKGDLPVQECKKIMQNLLKVSVIGVVPYEPVIKKHSCLDENLIFKKSDNTYRNAVQKILSQLVPTSTNPAKSKVSGFFNILSKISFR